MPANDDAKPDEERDTTGDPCHRFACRLQCATALARPADRRRECLGRNTYSPAKCDGAVRALYECCAQLHRNEGDAAIKASSACPSSIDNIRQKLATLGPSR